MWQGCHDKVSRCRVAAGPFDLSSHQTNFCEAMLLRARMSSIHIIKEDNGDKETVKMVPDILDSLSAAFLNNNSKVSRHVWATL